MQNSTRKHISNNHNQLKEGLIKGGKKQKSQILSCASQMQRGIKPPIRLDCLGLLGIMQPPWIIKGCLHRIM
ncbi:hypothetical protein F2Q70_00030488 [Brassica cretica]|uniref:Uncharacterized protein n=1 Tax=Brassica cretica TaxID=69181 RepID=A0A8S9FIZ5_BRACR|nr:hypothetical protein F2Q70_00030488 [Brassica cretica]